ncbi:MULTISPECIES: FAD-dependent oxidoreductase [unclassified Herbaspirillum]|uniref:FAD-dependent oxidoreductase n=1 Tax=unclassified Herbaspirillum TaxID=2624150 RepID=UPI000E2FC9E0|nr:FAD-dependent oxidoreductase [Herbaspirillum sp. 3R-3a1]TFI08595.1 FAD-dependent oxidoreductase [Herbaspirillum sp. 3R11]TFI15009.1 FAD-dependent oxidoreductase [Herbaspirillum sp. 3R-11]TFI20377.1 FAD-dependent oxidoreductase [Herbaspirillum sp. 3C11]
MLNETYDVIVVGCGVAGLAAAVSAAEGGARVAIIERAPIESRGGQSRYTEAYLRMKSETEVTDDFESFLAENGSGRIDPNLIEESAQPTPQRDALVNALSIADPEVIDALASGAAPTISWLKELGVRFDFLPTGFLTKTQPRLLPVGGGEALVETLAAKAENLSARFYYSTSALRLLRDDGNTVTGIVVKPQGAPALALTGQVILACGGFEGNQEMLTRYLGPRALHLRPICRGGYYNRGDGITMALDVGAATSGDFGSYHAEPMDPRSGISEPAIFVFPYGILVNKAGKRFTDEAPGPVDAYYERVTRKICQQDEGIAYLILDARHADIPNFRSGLRTDQPPVVGATLPVLAKKLDIPASALQQTVEAFNRACPADGQSRYRPFETDGVATTELDPPKSNWALPIDAAPFHAYPIISANVFTFGGVKTDALGRVLDQDGYPIPGLYAAGEMTGMYYGNYAGGTSVLRGLVFGRLAGRDAVSHINIAVTP